MPTACFSFTADPGSPTVSLLGGSSYYANPEITLGPGSTTAHLSVPAPTWNGNWEVYGDHLAEGAWTGSVTAGVAISTSHAIPSGSTFLELVFRESSGSAAMIGTYYCFTIDEPTLACQYGGQSNPDATLTYVITDTLIDAVVTGALVLTGQLELLPYVATALAAIEGSIPFAVNCSIVPVAGNPLDLRTPSTLSGDNLRTWFQQAAWNYFCQCTPGPPGSFAPTPPIPPEIIAPPGVVGIPKPTIVCDQSDLCTYLNHLEQLLSQIGTQVSYLRTDVRLIEHQHVPFDYVPGTLHSGLTGAGSIPVSGILAVVVQLTTVPASIGELFASPNVFFNAGWVTTGTDDGWRVSTAIGHNPQWIDAAFDDTQIGYSFTPGVVANIQTFSRQP